MFIEAKRLTLEKIEESPEIQNWLTQFDLRHVVNAKSLLCGLQFITLDDYSNWLLHKLNSYLNQKPIAMYAVRKFSNQAKNLWLSNGSVQKRPATTQGSEDLVASILANAQRRFPNCFLDHPSLKVLRAQKVRNILLIDDSVGSGSRVSRFIRLMTNHPTFKSWWSYGFITLHILSYARTHQSSFQILDQSPGSNYRKRKHKIVEKVKFDSTILYDSLDLNTRWGNNAQAILDLCNTTKKIAKDRRRGFGEVMGNIVFYHSVPNNIPGMLYSSRKGWVPLFSNRAIPEWLINLFESNKIKNIPSSTDEKYKFKLPEKFYTFLFYIKKGVRTKAAISRKMDIDIIIVSQIAEKCIKAGLITEAMRLTNSGYDVVYEKQNVKINYIKPDYSLYVPSSWCVDQRTIQPFVPYVAKAGARTDSVDILSTDGDDGESSLERTDAKATKSPMGVITLDTSLSQERDDTHGPTGLKE